MTTMEKLFVQVFERKRWIVDQVKHQSQLFDQHLASTLLMDGIIPPPWLLTQPNYSNPSELKKEELISGLLFPFPQAAAPYSVSHNSLGDQPIFTADSEQIRVFCGDSCITCGKPEAKGDTSILQKVAGAQECDLNDAPSLTFSPHDKTPHECVASCDPEPISTPTSLYSQDQRETSVPPSYHSLHQSFARIKRSKSRQKDLELRNSVKATKSSLRDECLAAVGPRMADVSGNAQSIIDHVDNMDLVRPSSTDCNVCSREEPQRVDCTIGGMDPMVSGVQPLFVDELIKSGSSHSTAENYGDLLLDSSLKSTDIELQIAESSKGKDKHNNIHCKSIKRSQSLTSYHCENKFPEFAGSCDFGHETRTLTEEVIHVASTGYSKECSEKLEAEIEFHQLDSDGLLRLDKSSDNGGEKARYSVDKSIQLQQIEASNILEEKRLNLRSFGSTVIQPISPGSGKFTRVELSTAATQAKATEMRVPSHKPAEGFPAQICSNVVDYSKNEVEVQISGLSTDSSVHVEPKQLHFDKVACFRSGLNEIAGTASEEKNQEELPAPGLNNSLDQDNARRVECYLFGTDACVEETDEGSKITIPDAGLLARDAFEVGMLQKKIPKGHSSVLENKITLPYDGTNVFEQPHNVAESSKLPNLKSLMRVDLSAERSANQFDSAKSSGSHESTVGYSPCLGANMSSELDIGEPAGSNMSSHHDLILGDHESVVHCGVPGNTGDPSLQDTNKDSSPCQGADRIESCISSLQDVCCSESYDHHVAGHTAPSEHKPSPHFGGSWPRSRQRSVGSGKNPPAASSTKNRTSLQSCHENSEDLHQEDVPNLEEIITAHDDNAAHCNVSCYPVNLDEQNLEDYAIQRFQFSPMQQYEQGEPGPSIDSGPLTKSASDPQFSLSGEREMIAPSGSVPEPRMYTKGKIKDQKGNEDEFESGDRERSASSEDPIEGKQSDFEEAFEFSSHLVGSSLSPVDLTDPDQMMPVLEGFFMQSGDEESGLSTGGCSFEKFDIRDSIVERASLMEQLCKSACMRTPSTHLSTVGELQKGSNSYQSVPSGLLQCVDPKSTQPFKDDAVGSFNGGFFTREDEGALDGKLSADCFYVSGAENDTKPSVSPVGKLWEKIISNSGSSKTKASLNPELPCISEENEVEVEAIGTSANESSLALLTSSAKRQPLADITEDPNCPASVSELENSRISLESVKNECSFSGTQKWPKQKLGTHKKSKKRHTSKIRDSMAMPRAARVSKMPMESLRNSVSQPNTSLQEDISGIVRKEAKRGNIVCNLASFIPLVQQKQAAVTVAGKRDVKVKALEAAEAARRQAEKREIERKMKKEALKVERAKMEQENMRQLELQKKKKEEEKKKKEADIATRKRLREEEERREKERKRKRVEDARKQQEEQKEKLLSKKEEKEMKAKSKVGEEKKDCNLKTLSQSEGAGNHSSGTVTEDGSLIPETPRHTLDNSKLTSFSNQGKDETLKGDGNEEKSYEISPYQCSDDEDEYEDDDNARPKKFIPSWASKNGIALAISSQHIIDPDLILPPDSFCSIDEVVLPRKLRLK